MIRLIWSAIMKWGWDYNRGLGCDELSTSRLYNEVDVGGLSFSVMVARGGTIVQVRNYDSVKDRTAINTHVIPEGEDIAEAIGHIVSMELLKS